MSVSLEEVINAGGYNLNDIEAARWLLGKKEEFEELIEKAEELENLFDDYSWEMQEFEDNDEYNKVIPFEEWRKVKGK